MFAPELLHEALVVHQLFSVGKNFEDQNGGIEDFLINVVNFMKANKVSFI